jgi:hypothetical protein
MDWRDWEERIEERARIAAMRQRDIDASRMHPVEDAAWRAVNELTGHLHVVGGRLSCLSEELLRAHLQRARAQRIQRGMMAVAAAALCFAAGFGTALLWVH